MRTSPSWENPNKYPANWKQLRLLVAERANQQCQDMNPNGSRCTELGTQCDHIINIKAGGTHDLENLQWLCQWHHKRKTAQEAQAGKKNLSIFRKPEQHPGMNI